MVYVGIDLHRPERAVRAGSVILGGASQAGADDDSAFGAGFLLRPLPPLLTNRQRPGPCCARQMALTST